MATFVGGFPHGRSGSDWKTRDFTLGSAGGLGIPALFGFKSARSVFDLNRSYSRELAARRATRVKLDEVKTLLASPRPEAEFEMELTPIKSRTHPGALVAVVSEHGRNSSYAKEVSSVFLESGYSVLGVDVRGWGETTPATENPDRRHTWEEIFAWGAIELGRPLLSLRVGDFLGALRRIAGEYKKIYAVGLDAGGLVALHAAAIDPSIAGVAMNRTLESYRDVLERPVSAEPVSSFIWGALSRYDLPELAQLILPRPCVAVDPFNAMRLPASRSSPMPGAAAAREILKGLGLSIGKLEKNE